ncbi:tetratricopeptide repeat protein [Microbulbifer sp. SAOS-129_SWC]|uniref:tetratricopeptide repeat protein n=1 Tax=Microbulbifer sp. SAOS-129_SWC TaxID=3145235 RepID=UPI003217304C
MNNSEHEQRQRLKPIVAMVQEQKFEQAVSLLKEYLLEFPQNEVALGMLASTYQQLGMSGDARDNFRKILSFNEENALARFQLGMTYFQEKNWSQALAEWQSLIESGTEYASLFYGAMCHLNMGDQESAVKYFKMSAKLMPKSHPLYGSLQDIASKLNFSLS